MQQPLRAKTQEDIVREALDYKSETITEKVHIPGIQGLHEKSTTEVAEVLANVLRSRPGVSVMKYVVGDYVELTYSTVVH